MKLDGTEVSLEAFCGALDRPAKLFPSDGVISKVRSAHQTVRKYAAGAEPIYGLNTGLGSNLEHRLSQEEISEFQLQIIAGRATACGDPMPEIVGRGVLLARIISAARGHSGISLELFRYLISFYESGLAPVIPEYGSVGDSDLVQNAHAAMAFLGLANCWRDGKIIAGSAALEEKNLKPPVLQPKEGLALVSHSGLTVTLSALSLQDATRTVEMARSAVLLSYEGYGANQKIFDGYINNLRTAPGQLEAANWFKNALAGSEHKPRRIQEALSFRSVAPLFGSSLHALAGGTTVWTSELNGSSDSPAVLDTGEMQSTINFQSPALNLALETVSLSLLPVADSSVQRMQKMMNSALSGLPAYLSPVGGASAGFAPTQKTATVLLTEVRNAATPLNFSPIPMSSGVEDLASMTPLVAQKLFRQLKPLKLLLGLEALTACQAIDLRQPKTVSKTTQKHHDLIRKHIPMMIEDRSLGNDIDICAHILFSQAAEHRGFSQP